MAKMSTEEMLDAFKEMSLLELSEFVKAFDAKETPTAPPASWAATYGPRSTHGRFCSRMSASVTAGLICAPETSPNIRMTA